MLGFLEFVTLNYASIFGLLQDAVCAHLTYWLVTYKIQHLNSGEFAWLGSIYYFGRLRHLDSRHHCANTGIGYFPFPAICCCSIATIYTSSMSVILHVRLQICHGVSSTDNFPACPGKS